MIELYVCFVFKQKTAYEMRISDWSSDVCSSDLGWVEHDAVHIWDDTVACVQGALADAGLAADEIDALGITNQRETTVLWDRATGQPVHPAIVWQDRRTSAFCQQHQDRNDWLNEKTGLLLDPYFSATKLAWLLDNVPEARARAERGEQIG